MEKYHGLNSSSISLAEVDPRESMKSEEIRFSY